MSFKTYNDNRFNSPFKLGDVVRITNHGHIYSTYYKAFEYFKIIDKCIPKNGIFFLDYEKNMSKTNWIVVDLAFHENDKNVVLYHIKNQYGQHLVVNERAITRRNIHLKNLKKLYKQNDNFIINIV